MQGCVSLEGCIQNVKSQYLLGVVFRDLRVFALKSLNMFRHYFL